MPPAKVQQQALQCLVPLASKSPKCSLQKHIEQLRTILNKKLTPRFIKKAKCKNLYYGQESLTVQEAINHRQAKIIAVTF